jgi:hypothetical protein
MLRSREATYFPLLRSPFLPHPPINLVWSDRLTERILRSIVVNWDPPNKVGSDRGR